MRAARRDTSGYAGYASLDQVSKIIILAIIGRLRRHAWVHKVQRRSISGALPSGVPARHLAECAARTPSAGMDHRLHRAHLMAHAYLCEGPVCTFVWGHLKLKAVRSSSARPSCMICTRTCRLLGTSRWCYQGARRGLPPSLHYSPLPRCASTMPQAARQRGAFILFEGIDRSGKTTQCAKLVEYLQGRQVGVTHACAPRAPRTPCAPCMHAHHAHCTPCAPCGWALQETARDGPPQGAHRLPGGSSPPIVCTPATGGLGAVALPGPHDRAGPDDQRVPVEQRGAERRGSPPDLRGQPLGEEVWRRRRRRPLRAARMPQPAPQPEQAMAAA